MSVLTTPKADMAFCPGCSHAMVLEHLAAALDRVGIAADNICFVSDIGCIGISDRYFASHTFHGLHGRSITYAEGIKRVRPELTVIVLIGDGGCGIGTAHLVHSARRNADIKVLVCNNFNYGMTGGQHSATTPPCAYTITTPAGANESPFDICSTVAVNGARWVGRCSAYDRECVDDLERFLRAPGFALLDVWELCVAHYVVHNKLNPPGLREMSHRLDLPFGVLRETRIHPIDTPAPKQAAETPPKTSEASRVSAPPVLQLPWAATTSICIAGTAGQRIRSAAGTIGEIAVAEGLFATQIDDFPITVRRGFSVSRLTVSRAPIVFTDTDRADITIILSQDGANRLASDGSSLVDGDVFADERVAVTNDWPSPQRFCLRDFERRCGKGTAALAVLACAMVFRDVVEADMLAACAKAHLRGKYRDDAINALDAGIAIAISLEHPHPIG